MDAFRPAPGLASRVQRRLRRQWIDLERKRAYRSRPSGFEPFQDCRSAWGTELVDQIPECDIINLHWVANGFLDYETFFARIPRRTPVVWTLHDMNPFTGGCHYDLGCGRYASVCGSCPQLGSKKERDSAFRVWQAKERAFRNTSKDRLRFVTPSRWLARECKRSGLTSEFPVEVIPYGLDLTEFAPRDRSYSREVLGLPRNAKVVLFLADGLNNRRKGFEVLIQALAGLEGVPDLLLLSLGRGGSGFSVAVPWRHFGFVSNDRLLSIIYSAVDLFVIPSLQDNLPNTIMEAMACGTPVVGTDAGGISELVRDGVSGRLVPPNDPSALRVALAELLQSSDQMSRLGLECRRIMTAEYDLEKQARRYLELYRAAAGKGKSRAARIEHSELPVAEGSLS